MTSPVALSARTLEKNRSRLALCKRDSSFKELVFDGNSGALLGFSPHRSPQAVSRSSTNLLADSRFQKLNSLSEKLRSPFPKFASTSCRHSFSFGVLVAPASAGLGRPAF